MSLESEAAPVDDGLDPLPVGKQGRTDDGAYVGGAVAAYTGGGGTTD